MKTLQAQFEKHYRKTTAYSGGYLNTRRLGGRRNQLAEQIPPLAQEQN